MGLFSDKAQCGYLWFRPVCFIFHLRRKDVKYYTSPGVEDQAKSQNYEYDGGWPTYSHDVP